MKLDGHGGAHVRSEEAKAFGPSRRTIRRRQWGPAVFAAIPTQGGRPRLKKIFESIRFCKSVVDNLAGARKCNSTTTRAAARRVIRIL